MKIIWRKRNCDLSFDTFIMGRFKSRDVEPKIVKKKKSFQPINTFNPNIKMHIKWYKICAKRIFMPLNLLIYFVWNINRFILSFRFALTLKCTPIFFSGWFLQHMKNEEKKVRWRGRNRERKRNRNKNGIERVRKRDCKKFGMVWGRKMKVVVQKKYLRRILKRFYSPNYIKCYT